MYDVTTFLASHPGGAKAILNLAGTDATGEFDPIHPPGTLEESLRPEQCLGEVDQTTKPSSESRDGNQQAADQSLDMTLDDCLNLDDIERLATAKASRKAWAYYFSAADDLRSKSFNNTVYQNILLRPRIFVDCTKCDTSTSVFGHYKVDVPFCVSPAAMARLGHPVGEHGIAQACAKFGALQLISNNSSQTPEQIVKDAPVDQVFGWQMYVQVDRAKSEAMLRRIEALPNIKFVVLTLDAPVPGKREHDERGDKVAANLPVKSKVKQKAEAGNDGSGMDNSGIDVSGPGGVGKALFAGTAADLTWRTTLPWLAKHTNLPIVLKGLQTHEDAYIASQHAPQVAAIILSNHGGRALDTAPPAIHTLLEIRRFCPEVFERVDVWVDGGIRRGTDVAKALALALGAKMVGVGRAPLWGLAAGGVAGVERVLGILKAEVETCMRLLGVERIEELGPQHVNARKVLDEIYDGLANLGGGFQTTLKAKL